MLSTRDCSAAELVRLIAEASRPGALRIVETPAELTFERAVAPLQNPGERGRVFDEQGELRWRKLEPDRYRVVYLGEDAGPAGMEDCTAELAGLERREFEVVLWGSYVARRGAFLDQSIQADLRYPLEAPKARQRAKLKGWHYVGADGAVAFSRYAAFFATEEA